MKTNKLVFVAISLLIFDMISFSESTLPGLYPPRPSTEEVPTQQQQTAAPPQPPMTPPDPKLTNYIKKVMMNDYRAMMILGDDEIDIRSLDPLHLPNFTYASPRGLIQYDIEIADFSIPGLADYTLRNISANPGRGHIYAVISYPGVIEGVGKYSLIGSVFGVVMRHDGDIVIRVNDADIRVISSLKRSSSKYFIPNVRMEMKEKKVEFFLGDDFPAGPLVNRLINARVVFQDVKPLIVEILSDSWVKKINDTLANYVIPKESVTTTRKIQTTPITSPSTIQEISSTSLTTTTEQFTYYPLPTSKPTPTTIAAEEPVSTTTSRKPSVIITKLPLSPSTTRKKATAVTQTVKSPATTKITLKTKRRPISLKLNTSATTRKPLSTTSSAAKLANILITTAKLRATTKRNVTKLRTTTKATTPATPATLRRPTNPKVTMQPIEERLSNISFNFTTPTPMLLNQSSTTERVTKTTELQNFTTTSETTTQIVENSTSFSNSSEIYQTSTQVIDDILQFVTKTGQNYRNTFKNSSPSSVQSSTIKTSTKSSKIKAKVTEDTISSPAGWDVTVRVRILTEKTIT